MQVIGTSPPTLPVGFTSDFTCDSSGALRTDRMRCSYKNITTQTTTVIKRGSGVLHAVTLNTPVATSVITIYDGIDTTGTKIATYTVAASPQPSSVVYDVVFTVGLTVVTATATTDLTVSYQ